MVAAVVVLTNKEMMIWLNRQEKMDTLFLSGCVCK